METEIKQIIEKNLPAQVGDVLKKRLAQADIDEETVRNQKETILSKEATIRGLEKTISDYKAFDNRNQALESREKAVSEQERNLKIATLTYEMAAEKEKTQFAKDVAMGLVRNTNYRKHVYDSEKQAPYYGANGEWIQPTPVSKSFDETKTED